MFLPTDDYASSSPLKCIIQLVSVGCLRVAPSYARVTPLLSHALNRRGSGRVPLPVFRQASNKIDQCHLSHNWVANFLCRAL
ncbi:hypothetical protein K474DRAFT_1659557 [Panus rudis PR-1116 ss-1]|nr:hypothetical protein K474DRAFT_1659557 [Panus rudis PR-1116 ss-1]